MYGLYGLKHHTVEISGDVTMRDRRTDERQTREDNATQPLDAGRLSFAIAKIAPGTYIVYQCWYFSLSLFMW